MHGIARWLRINSLNWNPPSFLVDDRSKRPGLASWVVGICEEVAATFFNIEVDFRLLRGRDDNSCDHEVRVYVGQHGSGRVTRLKWIS